MFDKTKIVLSAAIVLGTAFSASAATKPGVTHVNQSSLFTMIPGYAKDGSVVAIPDPNHYGQPQLSGNVTPNNVE